MTGKDLLLVVLVAGVAGAGAGIGASVAAPTAAPDTSADLAARLDRIENALAKAAESEKEARESVAKLSDRITGLQMDVGGLRLASDARDEGGETAANEPATRPGRAKRVVMRDGAQVIEYADSGGIVLAEGEKLAANPSVFKISRQMTDEAGAQLRAMSEGMRLRMLPEAERWKKAQEELHLTDAQVDGIKKAVADRDAAIKDAMQVETSADTAGNTRLTFRRMDPAKAATANQDFEKRMTDTLDADQEKTWKEKGYDHAFGGAGGGSRAVFLSASTIEMTTDDGKPGQK